jgi:glycosyltransferase involved in cell wall biosynthesis
MHIALNCQLLSMNVTGVTRYISGLVRALPRVDLAHKYTLLVSRRVPERLLPQAPNVEWRVTHFPINGTKTRILWEQFVQPLEVASRGFDVIHYTDRSMPWLPTGIPSVSTIQDISYASLPETYTWGKVLYNEITARIAAARADRMITASENTKSEVVRYLKVPEEKIRVICDAVDNMFQPVPSAEVLQEARQRLGLPDRMILYVGSLNPRKNLVTLIRAYAELKRTTDLPHKLVLVGPSEWKSDPVFHAVKDLGLESEIYLLGFVPDSELVCLYNLADLFVFPSLHEGFGLPPLEALACGTPVVCSNSASLPEVVGEAAIMVEPTDVKELAQAMERVLTDPDLAQQLRGKGLERAQLFSWEKTARETLKVYEEVARKGDLPGG